MSAEPRAEVVVVPASADRFADVATMLNPNGRPEACWCMHWRLPPKEDPSRRHEYLHALAEQDPAPGLLAYLADDGPDDDGPDDGPGRTVVGWVGLAPKSASRSLQRSRVLPRGEPESWPTTWAVMCFVVRPGYRRRGVARALLEAAVDYAREHGGCVVEGYPVEAGGGRVPVSAAFVGTVEMFEAVGFDRVGETPATTGKRPRWVLRRDLTTG
jgi:GNAT superfamily N-acetyltransferase